MTDYHLMSLRLVAAVYTIVLYLSHNNQSVVQSFSRRIVETSLRQKQLRSFIPNRYSSPAQNVNKLKKNHSAYATFSTLKGEDIPIERGIDEVSVDQRPIDYSKLMAFKGLTTDSFAHPVDIQVTRQLSRIPFIEGAARNMYSSIEQALVVENLGSSVLVGPQQMPQLYRSLLAASKTLDIDPPDIYVRQNPTPNAYTLAFMGKKPFIVIHTGLLDILSEKEVLAVIGHELGHLKCEHGVWITLLNLLTEFVNAIVGVQVQPLRSLLLRWQRSAEFTGDRASLLVTQDHKAVASVLMKLCGGSSKNSYAKDLNVDAFLEQAHRLKEEQRSLSGAAFMWANEQVATHPVPLVRAVELVEWYNSAQYSGLTKRARPLNLQD